MRGKVAKRLRREASERQIGSGEYINKEGVIRWTRLSFMSIYRRLKKEHKQQR